MDFTPSDECEELRYLSAEEAAKEKILPNVEKFLEVYQPGSAYNLSMSHTQKILCRDILGDPHLVDRKELVKRSSGYAIIRSEQGLLLVTDRTSGGQWEFPGGGVQDGEDKISALKREILEETGLRVSGQPKLVCEFVEYFYDLDSNKGWESTRSFYEVKGAGNPKLDGNGDDIIEARFFTQPLADQHLTKTTRLVLALV